MMLWFWHILIKKGNLLKEFSTKFLSPQATKMYFLLQESDCILELTSFCCISYKIFYKEWLIEADYAPESPHWLYWKFLSTLFVTHNIWLTNLT